MSTSVYERTSCRLRIEDYSVGWICALPIELAAATEMLDEEHSGLPRDCNETNLYTLGRIYEHNVVIACLPAGQMGANSAAAVATQMRSKFTSIRFGLMVGIGGGVPSAQSDIRLGDVVISQPYMQHGGVVQCDFGKTEAGRDFTRTGFLNTPPKVLLNGLAKFQSNRYRGKSNLSTYLAEISHLPEFAYDDTEPDILFKSTYNHVKGPTCGLCSKDELVERTSRSINDSVVHYGTIASGNQVVKDGVTRDRLSSDLGGVLCFEMEAAGLMNSFPCLVIRGICDYVDSHKNKRWQPYAAATAAACAKEILSVIPTADVAKICTVDEAVEKQQDPLFLVPYTQNAEFVGRSSILEKLKDYLGPRNHKEAMTTQPRAALFGLGGIGKTQIATEYAYWVQKEFPDMSIFWIHASDLDRFRQSFYQIAKSCQIPGHNSPKADILSLVRDWLERKDQRSWLLIIDNADDHEIFSDSSEARYNQPEGTNQPTSNPNLGRYIPECSHGLILITTRNKQAGIKLTRNRRVIEVVEMDPAESNQLIYKRLENNELDPDQVSLLTARLENLPLALVQATAFIQENSLTVLEYLELLNKSDDTLVELLSQSFEELGRDSMIPNAVTTTWIISFRQIRERHPLASDLLSLLSYFDRQEIPKSFVLHYEKQRRNQDDLQHKIKKGSFEVEKALGILKAFSFIKGSRASEKFNMHRLIQLVMRKWLNMRGKSKIWAGKALLVVSDLYPHESYEYWTVCGDYLPHVYAVLSHEGSSSTKEALAKTYLLSRSANFMSSQGQWNKAEELELQVVDTTLRLLGPKHPDTLTSMGNLASTYRDQGRWKEAEDLEAQVLEARKRVLGAEHPDTLTSMGNLASMYRDQGRWKEAEDLEARVLETIERVLGAEHPDTLTSMGNLASTYQNQGRWKEAEDLEVQVLETRKRVLGAEHPHTLTSMGNLASTYRNQGRWKEAEDLQAQALEIRKRVLGAEHPDILNSMGNLASTYRDQGRWKEAEDLQAQALEIRKRVLGAEHPNTLTSMSNLASTYQNQGRWEEAEDLYLQVLETRKRVLGVEHPDMLTSIGNLASTYQNQGRWKEAEDLQAQVLETIERVLGAEHPDTLTSMGNLASTYQNQGRWKEAEDLEARVLETIERVLGAEHPDTLTSMGNLASTYQNQGRWKEAEDLEAQVLETRKRVLGAEHPNTLTSMSNLASTYQNQGRWKEAEDLEAQVLETRKRVLGAEHPNTLTSMNNLAHTFYLQGRYEEAIHLMEGIVKRAEATIGPHHPHTLEAARSLYSWTHKAS